MNERIRKFNPGIRNACDKNNEKKIQFKCTFLVEQARHRVQQKFDHQEESRQNELIRMLHTETRRYMHRGSQIYALELRKESVRLGTPTSCRQCTRAGCAIQ